MEHRPRPGQGEGTQDDLKKWLGKIALAQSGHGRFAVERNPGHHARDSTGAPREGFPAGAPVDVDRRWNYPDCGVCGKVDFVPL